MVFFKHFKQRSAAPFQPRFRRDFQGTLAACGSLCFPRTVFRKYHTASRRSFTLITGVLLITGSLLLMLISISLIHIDLNTTQSSLREYLEVSAHADACMEEGLLRLKRDAAFITTSLSTSAHSCTITLQQTSPGVFAASVQALGGGQLRLSRSAVISRTVLGESVQLSISLYTFL